VLAYLRELLQPKPVSAAAAPSVAASTSASSLVHLSLSHVPPHNPSSRAHQVSGALAPSTGASSGGSSSGKELSQALGYDQYWIHVPGSDCMHSADARASSVSERNVLPVVCRVLLGLALVRGSLSDLLSLLDILLKRASQVASDEVCCFADLSCMLVDVYPGLLCPDSKTASEETFDIQAQLHCLGRFTDQQLVAYVAATGQLPSGSSRDRLVSLRSVVNGKALTAAADLTVSFTTVCGFASDLIHCSTRSLISLYPCPSPHNSHRMTPLSASSSSSSVIFKAHQPGTWRLRHCRAWNHPVSVTRASYHSAACTIPMYQPSWTAALVW